MQLQYIYNTYDYKPIHKVKHSHEIPLSMIFDPRKIVVCHK